MKKVSPKQAVFGELDLRPRSRAVHQQEVDLRAMPAGRSVGDDLHVVLCPKCGLGSLPTKTVKGVRFVHRGMLESTARTAHWQKTQFCWLDNEAFARAVSDRTIRLSRSGQILEVKRVA